MKKLTLPAIVLNGLCVELDQISPADCESSHDVLTVNGIVGSLKTAVKSFSEKNQKLIDKRNEIIEPVKESFEKAIKGLKPEQVQAVEQKFQAKLTAELEEKTKKLVDEVRLAADKLVTAEFTDKEFDRLGTLFLSDRIRKAYVSRDVYLSIMKALTK